MSIREVFSYTRRMRNFKIGRDAQPTVWLSCGLVQHRFYPGGPAHGPQLQCARKGLHMLSPILPAAVVRHAVTYAPCTRFPAVPLCHWPRADNERERAPPPLIPKPKLAKDERDCRSPRTRKRSSCPGRFSSPLSTSRSRCRPRRSCRATATARTVRREGRLGSCRSRSFRSRLGS